MASNVTPLSKNSNASLGLSLLGSEIILKPPKLILAKIECQNHFRVYSRLTSGATTHRISEVQSIKVCGNPWPIKKHTHGNTSRTFSPISMFFRFIFRSTLISCCFKSVGIGLDSLHQIHEP